MTSRIPVLGLAIIAGLASLTAADVEPAGNATNRGVLAEGFPLDSTVDATGRSLIERIAEQTSKAEGLARITVDYPLEASIVPPDFAAPTFLWHDLDSGAERWMVDVKFLDPTRRLTVLARDADPPVGEIDPVVISPHNAPYVPTEYQRSARAWRPRPDVWRTIRDGARAGPATITFVGYRDADPPTVLSRGSVSLSTSADPVGAPIFYRDVPLMPAVTEKGVIAPLPKGAIPLIKWRLRDVSRRDNRVMLEHMETCVNCHSFSADGATLGMDIDSRTGDKGAYAFARIAKQLVIDNDQVITWNSFADKPPGHKTLGFLSRVSPDGRYVVSTVNEAIYVQNFPDYRFGQVFFPTRGILAVYSKETGEFSALPGADDPSYVHCAPSWSPDGKTLIFSRAAARDPYDPDRPGAAYSGDPNEVQLQYDLYRMPFNEARGGTPEPVAGASSNGMSNSFPKVSPDGKWIVWVQSKNGMLMRPDGKLWIVPFEGGTPRMMTCNTSRMNSWHSFSPNARWMVFSSKVNTPYTQMFLTHIDEQGRDSPPLLIENSTAANRAVNLPEFVNVGYDDFQAITVPAADYHRYFRNGVTLAAQQRFDEALVELKKALAKEKDDSRVHENLSKTYMNLGQLERAEHHAAEALRINPFNVEMHSNLGFLLAQRGESERALAHMDRAIAILPHYPTGWYNRAAIHVQLGRLAEAESDYDEALSRNSGYADAYTGRGAVRRARGDQQGAIEDFTRASELKPVDASPLFLRALSRIDSGDRAGAIEDLERVLELLPEQGRRAAEARSVLARVRAGG